MSERYKVAGYVKLAKLWERSKDTAIPYHHQYTRRSSRIVPILNWWMCTLISQAAKK